MSFALSSFFTGVLFLLAIIPSAQASRDTGGGNGPRKGSSLLGIQEKCSEPELCSKRGEGQAEGPFLGGEQLEESGSKPRPEDT